MKSRQVFSTIGGERLANFEMFRSDKKTLSIIVKEDNQTNATLRFVACLNSEYPNGSPWIIKSGTDWTLELNTAKNVLIATTPLEIFDTVGFFNERICLRYEIERLGTTSDPTTLEQGLLFITPDISTNH
ncbi:MAG: hypothetical protein RL008_800 [Actinomycetota bacterium]